MIIDPNTELTDQQKEMRRRVHEAKQKHRNLTVVLASPVSGYVGEIDGSGLYLSNVVGAVVARVPASTMVGPQGQGMLIGQLQLEPALGAQQGVIASMKVSPELPCYSVTNMHPMDMMALVKVYEDLLQGHADSLAKVWGDPNIEWDPESERL